MREEAMQANDVAAIRVRGLVVPSLLIDLLREGRWHHPGEVALAGTMSWFLDPLDFFGSISEIEEESQSLDRLAQDEASAEVFRFARGCTATAPVKLPWLDVDQAFLIAVARYAGDDTGVALDYRTSPHDPRVVASDVWTQPGTGGWRVVAETFSAFVAELGLARQPD